MEAHVENVYMDNDSECTSRKRRRDDSDNRIQKFKRLDCPANMFSETTELVLLMMSFLEPLDLIRAGTVCEHWKELSKDRHTWCRIVKEEKFRVNTSTLEPPSWASSWQDVWKWFYLCKKRVFSEDDDKQGRGTFSWSSNGSRYEGEWSDNKENGRGIKYWQDGATYEGEWKDSKFSGVGTHTWASGSSYEGTWLNHKRNGYGKNTWVQKDCYSGQWVDDQKHGTGIYVWSDGRIYEGSWANDKRSGYGVFTWPKLGCKYEGEWKDDNRHGFGRFTWKDGDVYEGEWVRGKRFGKGKFITKDGQVFSQEWREVVEFDASNKGDTFSPKPAETSSDPSLDQAHPSKRTVPTEDDLLLASFFEEVGRT
eukprot:TRINITY_DN8562_c0_g1_i1.p1 TRINITY_DN8562_c0_g1~~TRINITY_DN8562_c0_g1_i1.p1  ORF type:complete len:385 (-),score=76.43 TRINITY_DN8562_c0_g1_i1:70-1167(-)